MGGLWHCFPHKPDHVGAIFHSALHSAPVPKRQRHPPWPEGIRTAEERDADFLVTPKMMMYWEIIIIIDIILILIFYCHYYYYHYYCHYYYFHYYVHYY